MKEKKSIVENIQNNKKKQKMTIYEELETEKSCNCNKFKPFIWHTMENMRKEYLEEKYKFEACLESNEFQDEISKNKEYIENINDCRVRFQQIEDGFKKMYDLYYHFCENCHCE